MRDGLLVRNPAKDRARRRIVGRSALPMAAPESPRDFALPDVHTLSRLVEEAVQRGGHQAWGDCVMILATTALRISEVAGLHVVDVDLQRGLLTVRRQTYPGRGGHQGDQGPPPAFGTNHRAAPRDAGATDGGQGQGCSSASRSSWRGDHDCYPARCDAVGRVG